MIGLSAPTFDTNGHIVLRAQARNSYQARRRGSVTATLDGGIAVYDAGYSESDQTFNATLKRATRAQLVTLRYLIAYYSELVACLDSGAYRVRAEFTVNRAQTLVTLRVLGRLDSA